MEDLTTGSILAGVASSAVLFIGNYVGRGYAWPVVKSKLQDMPQFSGDWIAEIKGGSNESFRLYLNLRHYAPYVRGRLQIEKSLAGKTGSTSDLRMTGYICDNHVALSGRTRIKDRRSISTILLKICAQSRTLKGAYCFRSLESGEMKSVDVAFERSGM